MESALHSASLGIPVGFLLLSIILLWFLIGAKGWWWLKATFIGSVVCFGFMVWISVNTYLGWPSRGELPPKFLVHWAHVQEPNKKTHHPGCIFIWLRPLEKEEVELDGIEGHITTMSQVLSYRNEEIEPRVHRIPYTRERHKAVQKMMGEIKKGRTFKTIF